VIVSGLLLWREPSACPAGVVSHGAILEHGAMKMHEKPGSLPLHDYDTALRSAVSWLGDNYLLAVPTARRKPDSLPYFGAPRHWIGAQRTPIRPRQ